MEEVELIKLNAANHEGIITIQFAESSDLNKMDIVQNSS